MPSYTVSILCRHLLNLYKTEYVLDVILLFFYILIAHFHKIPLADIDML